MADPIEAQQLVETSLDRVQQWVEDRQYRGYEPFDGLSSWFRPLTFGTLLGERLLMQLIRQCPINLRPIMGVTPKDSTKGRGYMAHGYLFRYKTTGNTEYLQKPKLVWTGWTITRPRNFEAQLEQPFRLFQPGRSLHQGRSDHCLDGAHRVRVSGGLRSDRDNALAGNRR